jgi:hypothetical protein
MATVNNMVMSHTDSLVNANQSDSGNILSQHLTTWHSDFVKCTNNLKDINEKASRLLSTNRGTGNDATALAQRSGGIGGGATDLARSQTFEPAKGIPLINGTAS